MAVHVRSVEPDAEGYSSLYILAKYGVGLLVTTTAYIFGLVMYRLYFHPLAKFPGPLFNAISSIPAIMSLLRGRLPMDTKVLHDKYGPVVRVSPNELAFNTVQAWEDIYGRRPGRQNLNKDPIHVGSVQSVEGVSTISMTDDMNHARQRRALSHGFSKQALWAQEDIVQGYVTKLMNHIHDFANSGESFNIVNWYNFMTFDVIGDLAFGESFGCLDNGDFHFWIKLIFETVKEGVLEQATRRFAGVGTFTQTALLSLIPKELRKIRSDHLDYSRAKVMRRLEKESDRKDFIYYIALQAQHFDLSQDEIIVNAALFIVAGSETTATALAALTNLLLRHSHVYKKLKDEIRGTFKSDEEIILRKVQDLPYLTACLEEALRIFPPAPLGLMRSVNAGGDTIDGYWLAGGTSVSVAAWAAHHSPQNFKDPDEFIPERWLDKSFISDQKLAFRPFSLGPRGCIGKNLSYLEMRLAIARLVWNFDLTSSDGAPQWDPSGEMKNLKAFGTWQKPDLWVTARRVEKYDGVAG